VQLRWEQLPARGPDFEAYRDLTLRIRATYERSQDDDPISDDDTALVRILIASARVLASGTPTRTDTDHLVIIDR
jgi:hypothetical protein